MTIQVTQLPEAQPRDRHVAIGVFDGVHRGHQAVIDEADTVLTFDPHPLALEDHPVVGVAVGELQLSDGVNGHPATVAALSQASMRSQQIVQ